MEPQYRSAHRQSLVFLHPSCGPPFVLCAQKMGMEVAPLRDSGHLASIHDHIHEGKEEVKSWFIG